VVHRAHHVGRTEEERREFRIIGVLGAGQMGGGIAQVAATAGYEVRLADASLEVAQKGRARIERCSRSKSRRPKSAPTEIAIVNRIVAVNAPQISGECDLVVEAATENIDLKLKLFRQCDEALQSPTRSSRATRRRSRSPSSPAPRSDPIAS